MKLRWSLVVAVSLLFGVAAWQVRGFGQTAQPRDEILAYSVSPTRSVTVGVHVGVQEVLITSWLLLPLGIGDQVLSYGLDVEYFSSAGVPVEHRVFELRTRHVTAETELGRAARLVEQSRDVSAARTIKIDTRTISAAGGRLRLSARRGHFSDLILMASHRVRRPQWQTSLIERTLSSSERTEVLGQRSSLGFFDMPQVLREKALSYRDRRLTALGTEGTDYHTRRLLLGPRQAPPRTMNWEAERLLVGPQRDLAFNLKGKTTLSLVGEPGVQLGVRDGFDAIPQEHQFDSEGHLHLTLKAAPARTLFIGSTTWTEIGVSGPSSLQRQLLGDQEHKVYSDRLKLEPDIRRQTYFKLRHSEPVTYSIPHGQTSLGLRLRHVAQATEHAREDEGVSPAARAKVHFFDAQGKLISERTILFKASISHNEWLQERFKLTDLQLPRTLSESRNGRLRVPSHSRKAEITGDSQLLVSAFVEEPEVEEEVLEAAYNIVLPPGSRWRLAPKAISRWSSIRPSNATYLRTSLRDELVEAQVRIEPQQRSSVSMPPVVLVPGERAVRRDWYRPAPYYPKGSWSDARWTVFRPGTIQNVVVKHDEPTRVRYLFDSKLLGKQWTLNSEDTIHRSPILTLIGESSIDLGTGTHKLFWNIHDEDEVTEKGHATLLVNTPTVKASTSWKQQRAHELRPGGSLTFRFARGVGELSSLIIQVATESKKRTVKIRYALHSAIDENAVTLHRRITQTEGLLVGTSGSDGTGLLWTEGNPRPQERPDRFVQLRIPLGDDLRAGRHKLTLSSAISTRLWLRVIKIGNRHVQH